jgi:hypothetical protein
MKSPIRIAACAIAVGASLASMGQGPGRKSIPVRVKLHSIATITLPDEGFPGSRTGRTEFDSNQESEALLPPRARAAGLIRPLSSPECPPCAAPR